MKMTRTGICYICFMLITLEDCVRSEERFTNMDNTNFAIKWRDSIETLTKMDPPPTLNDNNKDSSMVIKSSDNEMYYCVLPDNVRSSSDEEIITYDGPNEYQLLQPLFDQTTCSYRIESYWTYELCHGVHLRQYHEDKEMSQKAKTQEYILGKFDRLQGNKDYVPDKKGDDNSEATTEEEGNDDVKDLQLKPPKRVSVVNVDGLDFPFFQLNFTGGTPCDLTATPRRSFLKYVCHKEGRGEIYEIKETSTCEYQVIVLTYLLCSHPAYQKRTKPINEIECHSMEGAPRLPKNLQSIEFEMLSSKFGRTPTLEERVVVEDKPIDVTTYQPGDVARDKSQFSEPRVSTTISSNIDIQLLKEFLSGEYCLTGGSGWWHYEFCFGKKAIQFHEDRQTKTKTVILLGQWDESAHIKWVSANPGKKPKAKGEVKRNSLTNMYINGDICDLTHIPRFVEVKLKCKENPKQPHSVAIYLVEPKPCEYLLVVESPLLCSVVDEADENGLIDVPAFLQSLKKP